MRSVIWAEPRNITSISDCFFYHTMDIPNHGSVHGQWDLRGKETAYLGNTSFTSKRVLEIGTASGHLCFTMEKMGARVVAYDLSDEQKWDLVPYIDCDHEQLLSERKAFIRQLNNGFWFAHRAYNSRAKVVYGTAYEIPDDIGQFDICTFGSILSHLRDPFLALQRATAHVRETVIVTDIFWGLKGKVLTMAEVLTGVRLIRFLPNAKKRWPPDTWWNLSPGLVSEFLKILGFSQTVVSFHHQIYQNKKMKLYTVVGSKKTART
jgi:hypothetical protein